MGTHRPPRESAARLPVITKWNVGLFVKDSDLLPHFVTKYVAGTGKVWSFISLLEKSRVRVLQDCVDRRMLEAFPDAYKQWFPVEFARAGPLGTNSKRQFSRTFCKLLWAKIYLHHYEVSFANEGKKVKHEQAGRSHKSLDTAVPSGPSLEQTGPRALRSLRVKHEQAGPGNGSLDPVGPSSPSIEQRGPRNLSSLRVRHEQAGRRGRSNRSLDKAAPRSESPEHRGPSDVSSARVVEHEQVARRRSRNVILSDEGGAEEERQPQRRRLDASCRDVTNAFAQLTSALRSVFTTASARLTRALGNVESRRPDFETAEGIKSRSAESGDIRAELLAEKDQVVKLNSELAEIQEKVGTLESKVESLEQKVSRRKEIEEAANNLRAEIASTELHLRKQIQELKQENARLKRGQSRGRNSTAKCEESVQMNCCNKSPILT